MAKKLSDAEQVANYMSTLEHPMKAEIETLRAIIQGTDEKISERIKWNAPSYFYKEDMLTFGPLMRIMDGILLVFHHPCIVHIESEILEGKYKDRRLVTFKNSADVASKRTEIESIIREMIAYIDTQLIRQNV